MLGPIYLFEGMADIRAHGVMTVVEMSLLFHTKELDSETEQMSLCSMAITRMEDTRVEKGENYGSHPLNGPRHVTR